MKKERIQEQKDSLTWPEWRLYANFLHRELARLWYGKKSVFTLVKGDAENKEFWRLFGFILVAIIQRFGTTHGLAADEIDRRFEKVTKEYDRVAFISLLHELYWLICGLIGDKLASEFLYDFQITEIIALAVSVCGYAAQGKMPPYEKGADIRRLEFYESLPVAPELEEQFYGENPSPKS